MEKNTVIKNSLIPVVGKVSIGKSTFLNYVIGEEILETSNDITIKCIF